MPCRSVRPIAVIRGVLQGITVIGSGRRRVILQAVCKSGHGMPAGGSCRLAIAVRQSPTTSSGAVSTRLGRLLGLPLAMRSRASPIRANSGVVRYLSRPSSGKCSMPRHGLKPIGTAWALQRRKKAAQNPQ
jgi:hypothetical protein